MTETWKPIPGYEGLYEVSDHGRVRSLDRVVEFSDGRLRFQRGTDLKPNMRSRYWTVALSSAQRTTT